MKSSATARTLPAARRCLPANTEVSGESAAAREATSGAGAAGPLLERPYSCDRRDQQDERITSDCTRESFEAVFEAFVKLKAVPASTPDGHWEFVGWEGCQIMHENDTICEVKSGAFTLDERFPKATFRDNFAPTLTLGDPNTAVGNRAVAVSVATNEGGMQCRLDTTGFTPCADTATYSNVDQGTRTVTVTATDASGQSTTDSRTFRIIDTAIDSGPTEGSLQATRNATFTFGSGAGGVTFECRLQGPGTFVD